MAFGTMACAQNTGRAASLVSLPEQGRDFGTPVSNPTHIPAYNYIWKQTTSPVGAALT